MPFMMFSNARHLPGRMRFLRSSVLIRIWVTFVFLMMVPMAMARDLYVSANAVPSFPYGNWDDAFSDVQSALDYAENGDTIYLAGQTFAATNDFHLSGLTNVVVRGGYAATNAVDQPGVPDADQWPTVLTRQAGCTNRVLTISAVSGLSLERIEIAGGLTLFEDGAGVLVEDSVSVTLTDCVIRDNQATYPSGSGSLYGGGLYVRGISSVILSNCLVQANSLSTDRYVYPYGGGIAVGSGASLTAIHTVFNRNLSHNPSISANRQSMGGAVYSDGTLVLRNCLLIKNEARHTTTSAGFERGAGVYVAAGSAVLENCTLVHNYGEALYRAGGTVSVTNSIVWANRNAPVGSIGFAYSNVESEPEGNGNIAEDPLFEYGYYLATNSPCIDAGTNGTWLIGGVYSTQVDGSPDSGRVDMGYHHRAAFDLTWTNLYVAGDGNDAWSGLSPATAKRSIGAALSLAQHGSRINVSAGDYTSGVESFPLRVFDLNDVRIIGETGGGAQVDAGQVDRVLRVEYAPGFGLENILLTGGNADGHGGGIYMEYSYPGVQIISCVVSNNQTFGGGRQGGGIHIGRGSEVLIEDSLVVTNYAGTASGCGGGGLYLGQGSVLTLSRSKVMHNYARSSHTGLYGGGIRNAGGTLTLYSCVVAGNWLLYGSGNTTYETGHGIYTASSGAAFPATTTLENCTVVANRRGAAVGTPVIGLLRASGDLIVRNSILWDHNGKDVTESGTLIQYSNIGDGTGKGTDGNISADPIFVDAAGWNLRLQSQFGRYDAEGEMETDLLTSPCIDAGSNRAWMASALDLDGYDRLVKGLPTSASAKVDMGAIENPMRQRGTILIFR